MGECQRKLAVLICEQQDRQLEPHHADDTSQAHRVDVLNVRKVHVVLRELFQDVAVVNCLRPKVFVASQLRRPEDCEETRR